MRFAKMSFDLWGALSPTKSNISLGEEQEKPQCDDQGGGTQVTDNKETTAKRSMSQAELESSLFKASFFFIFRKLF